jgi:geranylgeranyl diphosphate synthase type II
MMRFADSRMQTMEKSTAKPLAPPDLSALTGPLAAMVEQDLERWLVEDGTPVALAQAMRYCCLNGGKRLRPVLAHMTARALGQRHVQEITRRAAVAVELVHCYSLVHDDLPGMDNDTLRRGRPTAHVKFGEAMAILAGDALLTRAFGVLGESGDPRCGPLVHELARAAGSAGIVAGQVADMKLCDLPAGPKGLEYIHLRKTAALLVAPARMGALCAGAEPALVDAAGEFARCLGLAYQAMDDLLDATASARQLGKTPGKDLQAGKLSAVAQLGVDGARQLSEDLTAQALAALEPLGSPADPLRQLARHLAGRTS